MTWLHQHWDAFLLACRRLAASPVNTLLSLLVIGVALALPAGGQMLLANARSLARSATPTPQVSLFMDVAAERAAAEAVGAQLAKRPDVGHYRFVPREETLARMKKSEGLGEVIDALQRNPFPDAYVIDPADGRPEAMEALAAELRKLPKVEHVQLDSAWARRLDALLNLGRDGVALLAALLGLGLVAVTFNTIRLQVLTRRAEVEVSRLLGATDAYVRRPFHYFGALQGLLGGAVAWLLVGAAGLWLARPIGELAQLYGLAFNLRPLGGADAAVLLALATGLGWLGASFSLRQYLRE
ncbi:MAG TPA: permease-like cell division protein FtsX [Rhodocyclaceae bacterium]|nr:permease-like cell division protein FtsX [Rhodocyclaceae bacterium]